MHSQTVRRACEPRQRACTRAWTVLRMYARACGVSKLRMLAPWQCHVCRATTRATTPGRARPRHACPTPTVRPGEGAWTHLRACCDAQHKARIQKGDECRVKPTSAKALLRAGAKLKHRPEEGGWGWERASTLPLQRMCEAGMEHLRPCSATGCSELLRAEL